MTSKNVIPKEETLDSVCKMMELKLVEMRTINSHIKMEDLVSYLLKVILVDKKMRDASDAAYFVFNIKVNRLVEFLNGQAVSQKNLSLADFKDMFQ